MKVYQKRSFKFNIISETGELKIYISALQVTYTQVYVSVEAIDLTLN